MDPNSVAIRWISSFDESEHKAKKSLVEANTGTYPNVEQALSLEGDFAQDELTQKIDELIDDKYRERGINRS